MSDTPAIVILAGAGAFRRVRFAIIRCPGRLWKGPRVDQ
jgi:hypothetical protein